MTTRTVSAVFEKGVFRPEGEVHLDEGARVEVTLPAPANAYEALKHVFGTMSEEDAQELDRVVQEGCERIDPSDWK